MTESDSPVWAILPIKSLAGAKQRLSGTLDADERRTLMYHSIRDVLRALSRSAALSGVLLVSKDRTALALGSACGAETLVTKADNGQSHAIECAVELLKRQGIDKTMTIPGDAPLLSPKDIDTICRTLTTKNTLTIVSNADGTGTNCIAASSPGLIPYQFGADSFRRHVLSAREVGVEPLILRRQGLELDIDTEADIRELLKHATASEAQRFLIASGIAARCRTSTAGQPLAFDPYPRSAQLHL